MPTLPISDGDDRVLHKPVGAREKALIRGFRYYHFRSKIAYSQARPTQLRLPRETTRLDCSGLVAACMDFAGLPGDWRYTNTDTQIQQGHKVTLGRARPGDVVFYGVGSDPSHEALYLGTLAHLRELVDVPGEVAAAMRDNDECVLSHGHYPMLIDHIDYRSDRIQIRSLLP